MALGEALLMGTLSGGLLALLIVLGIWDGVWKLIAMWKASKRNSVAWFIVLAVFNTVGILPILYLVLTKDKPVMAVKPAKKKKK